MGVSHSPEELAFKLSRLAIEYQDIQQSATKQGAALVKTSVQAIAPARLRGVGKRGARLGVRYITGGSGIESWANLRAQGPWQFIEADTHAHLIPKQRSSRGAVQRVAVIPGVGPRVNIVHPGTKGKHPWLKGTEAAKPLVTKLFESRANLALNRIF